MQVPSQTYEPETRDGTQQSTLTVSPGDSDVQSLRTSTLEHCVYFANLAMLEISISEN